MRSPRTHLGRTSAFSLIELLTVVVIVAIAAALVVPQLAGSADFEAQGAARAVMGDLLYARNDAVAAQAERRVVFDAANNSYRLTDSGDNTLPAPWMGGSYRRDFGGGEFGQVQITDADFDGSATVRFDTLGTPLQGGTVEIRAGEHRYRVRVVGVTGRIEVEEVDG